MAGSPLIQVNAARRQHANLRPVHLGKCRNCHDYSSMDLTRQGSRAAQTHKLWLGTQKKTCIDCHKGVAHHLPDMTGVPQG